MTALARVQATPRLTWSFWAAGGCLLLWQILLFALKPAGRRRIVVVQPRPQHYIQTFCHSCVFAYWGYYWRPVYDFFPLLAAQLLFAYAFDILLTWSRGEDYQLGWGPFPIVFSTNLFLWFRDDVFYWQFLLIAVGFAGKAFVRWNRDVDSGAPGAAAALGSKRVHIFNPSAFTLAIFSIVLLATGTTSLTWGQEIATTFSLGPQIYTVLFAIGLVVMYFFSITPVTAGAAATLVAGSLLYRGITGVPYFVDSDIPSAVFLGLHLLVTDPSTSPRTPFGRLIFGVLYGIGVFALYSVLGALGLPTFYDKLLCVPLLNLAVPAIDRAVRGMGRPAILHSLRLDGPLGKGNLAHMAVWAIFFGWMTTVGAADGKHTGDSLPFWVHACSEQRPQACERLLRIEASYCGDNAGWACNELGSYYAEGRIIGRDPERAFSYFARACEGRFQAGCVNLLDGGTPIRANPRPIDLRLLLREGGPNLLDMPEPELYQRACGHGWTFACEGTAALVPQTPSPKPQLPAQAPSPRPQVPGFVEVPAGPFVMGADRAGDPLAYDNERWSLGEGVGTIDLPSFFIAQREVTVAEFTKFAHATKWPVDPRALAAPADHPVAYVTWPEAVAYARWLDTEMKATLPPGWHVQLPTEAQWEKAARGTDRRRFPWGDEPRQDRANFGSGGTIPAGQLACPECAHGLSDMAGNVWEWTRSPYQPYPYTEADDRAGLERDALWVMRGGGFADPPQLIRTTTHGAAEPGARRAFIGFRLAIATAN